MFEFTIEATSSAARTGTLVLPHGTIDTPALTPVGTPGPVRTRSPADLQSVGAGPALPPTYPLPGRPGAGRPPGTPSSGRCDGWNGAPHGTANWRTGARPSGPSCRAAPTWGCARKVSAGSAISLPGPASLSAACP